MTALTPADPDQQTPELWQRITGHGWPDPGHCEAISMALRAHAIRALSDAMQDHPDAAPLAAAVEADEDDDYWYGSSRVAQRLGLMTIASGPAAATGAPAR